MQTTTQAKKKKKGAQRPSLLFKSRIYSNGILLCVK